MEAGNQEAGSEAAGNGEAVANRHRGEVELSLDGRRFVLRPSFAAIAEIEARCGEGVIALARRLAAGDIRVSDFAAVVTAGLKAAGEPARFETVGEMVLREGLGSLAPTVGEFLRQAISGGRTEA